jgi:hypothetical protein
MSTENGREMDDAELWEYLEPFIDEIWDHLEPFVEEVMPDDKEIERMLGEAREHLADPETGAVRRDEADRLATVYLKRAVTQRLGETYPHLFDYEGKES